ncbi:MAG: hypothetical protein LUC88_11220 [Prevotella sp.]|nr:hypothetical protein [Prevotella sp.]
MLIEIGKDIINAAVDKTENYSIACSILKDCCFVLSKGMHLIYIENESLNKLINCKDENVNNIFFRRLKTDKATLYSFVRKVSFRAKVTFQEHTHKKKNEIVINPIENNEFRIWEETHLLCENLDDCDFYEYVCDFYKKVNNLLAVNTSMEMTHGGGNTTFEIYQKAIENKLYFMLAIADSDKIYPGYSTCGETANKLMQCDNNNRTYFNVQWYILKCVSEIENLVPWNIVTNCCANAYGFKYIIDKSFFDLKKGILCYNIRKKEEGYYNYWKNQFKNYDDVILKIDNARNCTDDNCPKGCNRDKQVVKSACGGILTTVLVSGKEEFQNLLPQNLSESQLTEWNTIGKLIFEWCCGMKTIRV